MDKLIESKAKTLASRNYAIETLTDNSQEEGQFYFVFNPELSGCMAQGSTIEEAIQNLSDARLDYIASLLQDGLEVPSPSVKVISCSTTDLAASNTNGQYVTQTVNFGGDQVVKDRINSGQKTSLFEISCC